jgi:hypothetical protein
LKIITQNGDAKIQTLRSLVAFSLILDDVITLGLNELCLWTLSIVWCLKNKKLKLKINNYRQKIKPEQIKTHTSTNKSHRDQLQTTEQLGTYTHKHLKPEKTQVAISDTATHNSQHAKRPKYQYRSNEPGKTHTTHNCTQPWAHTHT